MTTLYFAYGSNMDKAQMAERCPGARPLGPAVLRDWEFLIFSRGYATLKSAPGSAVLGVLWECTEEHIRTLDRREGVHVGLYQRHSLRVEMLEQGGIVPQALVYIQHCTTENTPNPGYLEKILRGAGEHGLDPGYIAWLEMWKHGSRPEGPCPGIPLLEER